MKFILIFVLIFTVNAFAQTKGETKTNSIGMELVYIPAGSFMMGSPANEPWRDADEGPMRKVNLEGFLHGQIRSYPGAIPKGDWHQSKRTS